MLLALCVTIALCTFTCEVIHLGHTATLIPTWPSDTWVRTVVYIHTSKGSCQNLQWLVVDHHLQKMLPIQHMNRSQAQFCIYACCIYQEKAQRSSFFNNKMQNYHKNRVNGFIKYGFRKAFNCTIILHLQ